MQAQSPCREFACKALAHNVVEGSSEGRTWKGLGGVFAYLWEHALYPGGDGALYLINDLCLATQHTQPLILCHPAPGKTALHSVLILAGHAPCISARDPQARKQAPTVATQVQPVSSFNQTISNTLGQQPLTPPSHGRAAGVAQRNISGSQWGCHRTALQAATPRPLVAMTKHGFPAEPKQAPQRPLPYTHDQGTEHTPSQPASPASPPAHLSSELVRMPMSRFMSTTASTNTYTTASAEAATGLWECLYMGFRSALPATQLHGRGRAGQGSAGTQ